MSDALLLCAGSCIAVFRDRSGRFGYFDSHCRSIYGMPVDEGTGTAVFLTFHQLPDLVDRLLLLFQGLFDLRDQEEFELLPVSFISMMTESCVRTEVSLNCCDLEHDVQPSVSFENKALSNDEQCSSADVPQQYVQVQESVQQLSETAVNRATSTDEQAHLTEVSLNCCDLNMMCNHPSRLRTKLCQTMNSARLLMSHNSMFKSKIQFINYLRLLLTEPHQLMNKHT